MLIIVLFLSSCTCIDDTDSKIESDSLPNGKHNTYYSAKIDYSSAQFPTFSISGSLPPGLSLSDNRIMGTPNVPSAPQSYTFTFRISAACRKYCSENTTTNECECLSTYCSDSRQFTITINP